MSNAILFQEITIHLMHDEKPSVYLDELITKKAEEYPISMLYRLKETKQSPIHHPEGTAFVHTIMVVDQAAKVKKKASNEAVFMWAALLHDIGKPNTTRNRKGKITSYDHDKVGHRLSEEFLSALTNDTTFIKQVSSLVRWHMQILFVVNSLPFADVKAMKQQVSVEDIALLGYCDRMGRTNANHEKEERNIKEFIRLTK
ncbi:HDIG domain-containing protein [Paludicola sp. MB14-C6]|uniref:HDIG domain-containing metalloprotein n=1 Tax=Paludihabitans sp. MB14-C6 TaxID=3070656 RepID=UPI0027DB4F4C|nr:HDIG domain-containing metalloprotein [Paludicola sp. MB14-C6]WMJ22435.1 HDIG domain-containing protein [Paludicola sp. MB14-C6]